jgi:hypothetical protein
MEKSLLEEGTLVLVLREHAAWAVYDYGFQMCGSSFCRYL